MVAPDGTVYKDGETADVPGDEATRWVSNGWAISVEQGSSEEKAEAMPTGEG